MKNLKIKKNGGERVVSLSKYIFENNTFLTICENKLSDKTFIQNFIISFYYNFVVPY